MVFDLTGDDERANKTKKVVVRNKSANIFESIVLDVPIPIDHLYAPVLTIYCYDHVLGFVRRLVGISQLPLKTFVSKLLTK